MKRSLSVSIIYLRAPASWPSLSIIQPQMIKMIKKAFPQTRCLNILENQIFLDDVWVFPPGTVQAPVLTWLNNNFKDPLKRPRGVFSLGGEGAKLCYHLYHYRDLFRPDDLWVVSCEAEKRLIDHWFPNNNRTHVLHYPVEKQFKPVKDKTEIRKLRKKLKFPEKKIIVLYAGRISPQKNILSLLDLLSANKNLYLLICGDIDSLGVPHLKKAKRYNLWNDLVKTIGSRNLSSQVEFRPHQSQKDLQKIMKACDYQVSLSSHYGEDFGYSIAQGLCSGLKTILSSWGGHHNWRSLISKRSVTYLTLDWPNKQEIGIPKNSKTLKLPQKSPNEFSKDYNKKIALKLKGLIMTSSNHNTDLKVHPELINFWEQKKEYMFDSTDHPLFKKVIKEYQSS